MSTHEPTNPHEHWEQLAAGYALDALEPDERAEFVDHLATCERCHERVDQHSLVAAQLGSLAGDDVSPPPWSAIRTGVIGDADVVVLRRRPRWATLAAAAVAVAVVGTGVATWQLTRGTNTPQPLASAAACRGTTGCHVVTLSSSTGLHTDLIVHDGRVAVLPTSMPSLPAGREWALWQLPRTGTPTLLTEFATGRPTATLTLQYDDIAGFALSQEPVGTAPTTPSEIVASGTAS